MKKSDVIPALLLLVLSAAIAFDTRSLSFWSDTTPGPAFLPAWLAVAGVVLCVLRLAEARRSGGGAPLQWPDKPALLRIAMIFAGLVAVPMLAPLFGLILSLALFVAWLLLVLLRQRPWPSLVTTAITVGAIYAIFVWWLRVPLPTGLLGI